MKASFPVVVRKKVSAVDAEKPDVEFPQLEKHDIDIPEEPEKVRVVTHVWNAATATFEERDLGELLLVPTGCDDPVEVDPYENTVTLRSALPRDKEKDANLFALYRKEQLVSRDWVRNAIDEDIDASKEDRKIQDDIPLMLSADPSSQKANANGVAQTAGLSASKASVPQPEE